MPPAAAAGQRGAWCLTKAAKFAARSKFELYVLLADADEKVVAMAERMNGVSPAPKKSAVLGDASATQGAGAADKPAAQVRQRRPRKISADRKALLDERFREKRMKTKLFKVLPFWCSNGLHASLRRWKLRS